MVGYELEQRYDEVNLTYVDVVAKPDQLSAELEEEIRSRGLFWPVSAINGRIFFDGILTLPRVIQAVEDERSRLARLAED